MEKIIETQLRKLGELIESGPMHQSLSEDEILAFVEDQLDDERLKKIEDIIVQNPQLCEEIFILRKMVGEKPTRKPSIELHDSVLKKLNLSKSYLMEIAIKISKELISVIKGDNFVQDNTVPVLASRGMKDSLIVFRSEVFPYFVTCKIQPKENRQFIHFSLENNEGEKLRNGRFIIKDNKSKILEILTDRTGSTEQKTIQFGEYEVEVSIGKEFLGSIKINISR